MIEGITGLPGAGKTLWCVSRMLKEAQKGRRIITNFPSTSNPPKWNTALWSEMIEEYCAWIVIDEAQMWFSAREWTKTKQCELGVFQQHRKNGLDLTWIAQHENRVDVGIREITAYIWRVHRIGKLFILRKFTPDDNKKPISTRFAWLNEEWFSEYDTFQIIGDREGAGGRVGAGRILRPETNQAPCVDLSHRFIRLVYADRRVRYCRADKMKESYLVGCVHMNDNCQFPTVQKMSQFQELYSRADKLLSPTNTVQLRMLHSQPCNP